jgi:hypothetical protein
MKTRPSAEMCRDPYGVITLELLSKDTCISNRRVTERQSSRRQWSQVRGPDYTNICQCSRCWLNYTWIQRGNHKHISKTVSNYVIRITDLFDILFHIPIIYTISSFVYTFCIFTYYVNSSFMSHIGLLDTWRWQPSRDRPDDASECPSTSTRLLS